MHLLERPRVSGASQQTTRVRASLEPLSLPPACGTGRARASRSHRDLRPVADAPGGQMCPIVTPRNRSPCAAPARPACARPRRPRCRRPPGATPNAGLRPRACAPWSSTASPASRASGDTLKPVVHATASASTCSPFSSSRPSAATLATVASRPRPAPGQPRPPRGLRRPRASRQPEWGWDDPRWTVAKHLALALSVGSWNT